jgi:betaine-aldehyde dehydrogenase
MQQYKMWIDGKWEDAISGKSSEVLNPATEEEITRVPCGDKADVDKAVAAARRAFPNWSKRSQSERSRIVRRIANAVIEHASELDEIDRINHGTPISFPSKAVNAAGRLEWAANISESFMGSIVPINPERAAYLQRVPLGVCAIIAPWNVVLPLIAAKLGPALALGNTCVIKPPSIEPLVALKLAEILEKLDIPQGIVNIITGPGSKVGEALASHPDVDMIGFTGGSETGKTIMSLASRTVKRFQLELGGKNPVIVLKDAEVGKAAAISVLQQCSNTGQVCGSPGRYYIHEEIYDEFVEKFVVGARSVVVGNPNDKKTQMGPVVSAEQRNKVESYIKSGIEEGAKLILGGKRPTNPPLDKGYFVMPTVFTDVNQNMRIAREEIFGPVACIMNKFSSEDEVIKLANDNTYGLCATVWTRDAGKAMRFANELYTGSVHMNDTGGPSPQLPWGGFKESGIGKEGSVCGLEEYTQIKLITVDLKK